MNFDLNSTQFLVTIAVVVVLIIVGIAFYLRTRRRTSASLRNRFGPEYDRAVLAHGSERKAEAKLADRESRVEGLNICELSATDRARFIADWHGVQSRFLDHPKGSVVEADELISALLVARGYPVAEFDRRAADISVNHPRVVESYRSAHGIAVRLGNNNANTEELRTAMIEYRSLFEELVEVQPSEGIKAVA